MQVNDSTMLPFKLCSLCWEFYYFDFSRRHVWRGETSLELGYRTDGSVRLTVPVSEESQEFFLYFKLGKSFLY